MSWRYRSWLSRCSGALRLLSLCLCGLLTAATTQGLGMAEEDRPLGQRGTWHLMFSDDFDGHVLDAGKWVTCYWWDSNGCTNLGNHELQWYRPENIAVGDGHLRLRAERRAVIGHGGAIYEYTSGLVSTGRIVEDLSRPVRFELEHGYAEMRARIPAGRALLSQFWLLASDNTSKPEVDVMEVLGQDPHTLYMHVHYLDAQGRINRPFEVFRTADLSAGWHVYGVEVQDDTIIWYLDGVERWRYDNSHHLVKGPMYIIINLAVGGDWVGFPDRSTQFPADFLIDYVRVWHRGSESQ